MRSRTGLVAIAAFVCLWGLPVQAQQPRVVSSCGTAPTGIPYTPGQPAPPTLDINGLTCTSAAGGSPGAVTIANGADVALGNTADAAWSGTGASTVVAALKNIALGVAGSIPAGSNTIGTVLIGAGSSVIGHVIVDSGTITANAGTNLNTSLLALETGGNLAATATNTGTTNTDLGPPGATACVTDTGSCSLNALLQRVAQRLTTAIGGTAVTGTVTANNAVNVTATDCSGTITSGGTAQNAFTAQTTLHGFTIVNIDTTEALWISFTTTAAASGSGSYPLQAATATTFAEPGSFTSPPGLGLNHALSVIATTTSHKFTCTWW